MKALSVIFLYIVILWIAMSSCSPLHHSDYGPHQYIDSSLQSLLLSDTTDFVLARKGFIATREDPLILNASGQVIMDLGWFDFMKGPAPLEVHPSLWRQGQLNSMHGLYEVTDGIYQVRGFDLANMTVIATRSGWIVVDPLTTSEVARAAMDLVDHHLGARPVKAVIFTHSHIDHFGGVKGIVNEEQVKTQNIEVIAPEGFYESAISENILAGNAMLRRAMYMFGSLLPKNNSGFVGSGLGQAVSLGTAGILQPTITIDRTGQRVTIDGIEMIFQNTPDAEAPAELMFYMPLYNAFCQAEEINHTLHNLYTLRGAQVRNGLKWSKYIDESIRMFGQDVNISFGSHHWPTWGKEAILDLWTRQRDIYRYIHDETLHLANNGYNMTEIAEQITLPPSLDLFFANRGYYGTVNHNAKAQYQLYFGWFDGNPAHLHALPEVEASKKYVAYMGGAARILGRVREDMEKGEHRWVAMILNHLVMAYPENEEAQQLLAETYDVLGSRSESGPWRNFYLTGAQELRQGASVKHLAGRSDNNQIIASMSLEDFYDLMAIRLDRELTGDSSYIFNMIYPDTDEQITVLLVNRVLHNRPDVLSANPTATVTMERTSLNDLITQKTTIQHLMQSGMIKIEGNAQAYFHFLQMVSVPFDPLFKIVEPPSSGVESDNGGETHRDGEDVGHG